jgi:MoaA/NifB/PqqE/SkfB family radical SAM enzyme
MCTNPERPWPAWDGSFDYDYSSIIGRLEKRKKEILKDDSIYITGGEPTLHPNFLDIIEYLSKNFSKQAIKLLTNGRMFSYADFAKKFLSINPKIEIEVSLYGPSAKIHDSVTGARGSFQQTLAGLKNLLKYRKQDQQIGIRFVITKLSYNRIEDFFEMAIKNFSQADRVIIIFMEYEGSAIKNPSSNIQYKLTEVSLKNIDKYFKMLKEVRMYHFPLCVIDKKFWPYVWKTWPKQEIKFVKACRDCQAKKHCSGIHKGYLKAVGDKEFSSVKNKIKLKKINNPFNPLKEMF